MEWEEGKGQEWKGKERKGEGKLPIISYTPSFSFLEMCLLELN